MLDWDALSARLDPQHVQALRWFADHAGETVAWSEIAAQADLGARLVNQAKGIYKPAYTDYALSVRQTLTGPYDDLEPERRPDGSWLYPYFQENPDPALRDKAATNRGLMKCMEDGIPVGVLIQSKPKPGVEYEALGLARVVDWNDGYFYLEGFTSDGHVPAPASHSDAAKARSRAEQTIANEDPFDVTDQSDRRDKAIREVVRRRGQAKFRKSLLEVYGGVCAITGCDATEALEAAHITPYLGDATNHVQNGLLLRADLHNLFDLGLLAVDPVTFVVRLAPSLRKSFYAPLDRQRINLPEKAGHAPSTEALAQHMAWTGLQE